MPAIRMGVVGAGTISLRGILPHLSQSDVQDRVRLQAVCDPFPGRAEAAADRFDIPRAFASLSALLESGDVDAVCIASPIGLHYEQGKAALLAGKHVHFNKTMTTTAAEATELIDIARQKGLKIVASPGEVLRPQIQAVRRLIREGAIGVVAWAICGASLGRYHERERERQGEDVLSNIDPRWYFCKPGGGPLYDMTVYALHGITSVLGSVKRVTAFSGLRIAQRMFKDEMVPCDAHDNTLILLDFGDNLFAIAHGTAAGQVTRGFLATYLGTEGRIEGYKLNGQPIDYPGREIAEAPGGSGQWLLPHVVGPHRQIEEEHVFEDIMQLVDWVAMDKPSPVTAEHARHVIEIIDAAYRAAETGQAQELATAIDPPHR